MKSCIKLQLVQLAILMVGLLSSGHAATRFVSPTGGNTPPYTTWETAAQSPADAVAACEDGDTVRVADGSYGLASTLVISNQISLISENGPDAAILSGNNDFRCLHIAQSNALVSGFTLTQGYADEGGGALVGPGAVLRGCILLDNEAAYGAGVSVSNGTAIRCLVTGNDAAYGAVCLRGAGRLLQSVVSNNHAVTQGGGVYFELGGLAENCLIVHNVSETHGGGVSLHHGGRLMHCTIANNTAALMGGGIYLTNHITSGYSAEVINTLLWSNTAANGPNWQNAAEAGSFTYAGCDSTPDLGAGNISENPRWIGSVTGDYRLALGSPLIDQKSAQEGATEDIRGQARPVDGDGDGLALPDVGAYEAPGVAVAQSRFGCDVTSIARSINPGETAAPAALNIWNAGGGSLDYTVRVSAAWLAVEPAAAGAASGWTNEHTAILGTASLPPGQRTEYLTLFDPRAAEQMLVIPVTITVASSAAFPGWSPQSFSKAVDYGSNAETQRFLVWNAGVGTLQYSLTTRGTGLAVSASSGACDPGVTNVHELTFDASNVMAGRHPGAVILTPDGLPAQTAAVSFVVQPIMRFRQELLTNSVQQGSDAFAQNIHVAADGNPTFGITYDVESSARWMTVTPTQAVSIGEEDSFQVIYSSATLQPGVYPGVIRATPSGFPESARSLAMRLDVLPPEGHFEERIVFSSNRNGKEFDIYSMLPDGLDMVALIERPGDQVHPRLSPNGSMIAFLDSSSGSWRLIVLRFQDRQEWSLPPLEEFEWMPENSGLAGVESLSDVGTDILVNPLEAAPYTLIRDSGRQALWDFDGSPRQAFFTTDPGDWNAAKLMALHLDSSRKTMLIKADARARCHGNLSPDGRLLAYSRAVEKESVVRRIAVRTPAEDALERVISATPDAEIDDSPRWSPTGRQVVFSRTRGKSAMSLLTINHDGTGEKTLVQDDYYNQQPDWGWVLVNEPAAPVFNISHTEVSGRTAPEGMASKRVNIWNSGTGPLHYQVEFSPAWVTVVPSNGVSRGARNAHEIRMSAAGLTHGSYDGAVHFVSDGGEAWVNVRLDVIATNAYTLTVDTEPDELGDVQVSPAPGPDGKYAAGQYLTLTAVPRGASQFVGWRGAGLSGTALETNLILNGDQYVTALFYQETALTGWVSNRVTGSRLANVRLYAGTNMVYSSRQIPYVPGSQAGWYEFPNLVCGQTLSLRAELEGFGMYSDWHYTPNCFTNNMLNIGLQPDLVRNVVARQRPGSLLVDVTYDLIAPSTWRPRVELDVANLDAGYFDYTNFMGEMSGDIGNRVAPGVGKRFSFSSAYLYRYAFLRTNAAVRLRCEGSEAVSPGFRLQNGYIDQWYVYIWADRNNNNLYDYGEELRDAEVYYRGRTAAHRLGTTDSWGRILIREIAEEGAILFARKKIYTMPAAKPGHEAVDNTMYDLWLDTDIGGPENSDWDGTWRSYTLTRDDVNRAQGFLPVYVRAKHPVFEWNLLVHGEFNWGVWYSDFTNSFKKASTLLYDVSDGQMKFGKVAIVTDMRPRNGDARWHNADIVVFDWYMFPTTNSIEYVPTNHPYAEFGPGDGVGSVNRVGNFHICFGLRWVGCTPTGYGYYSTIIHEFGHYALSFRDEYNNGNNNRGGWDNYRWHYPHRARRYFGIMDLSYGSAPDEFTEWSSYNDYLPAYPVGTPTQVTMQAYANSLHNQASPFYPCFNYVKKNFQTNYAGYNVEIIAPRYGYYQPFYTGNPPTMVEASTSPDRPGPTHVPAPYADCLFAPRTRRAAEPETTAAALITLTAHAEGQPVSGARLSLRRAVNGRVVRLGHTDGQGRFVCHPLEVGDEVRAVWNDREKIMSIGLEQAGRDISLDLSAPASRRADSSAAWRSGVISTTNLGLVVCGDLDASANLGVRLYAGMDLAAAPSGTVECAETDCTTPIEFASVSPVLATAQVQMTTAPYGGYLLLSATATNGQTRGDALLYDTHDIEPGQFTQIRSQEGSVIFSTTPESLSVATRLFIGRSGLPPPAPADNVVQVGPVLLLAADQPITSCTLNWYYPESDLEGVDGESLLLARWDENTLNWTWVENSGMDVVHHIASAMLTNLGAFALFANPSTDVTPPNAVADLSSSVAGDSVLLGWTAPDDNPSGPVTSYILKSAPEFITVDNWDTAVEHPVSFRPAAPGEPENTSVNVPMAGGNYFFVVRSLDRAGNLSDLSNVASVQAPVQGANEDGLPQQWIDSVSRGGTLALGAADDADDDGLPTEEEYYRNTDPGNADTDGDGLGDKYEVDNHLNPNDATDAELDPDQDTLSNKRESELGTDPNSADTDGDGMPDPWEHDTGLDPTTTANGNGAEDDPDADQFINGDEFTADTLPTNAASFLALTGFSVTPEGRLRIAWQGGSNSIQYIERATNLSLAVPDWPAVFTNHPPTSETASWTNPIPATHSIEIYRIRAERP